MSNYAWVTLATNDSYSLGALVVAFSLKRVHTAHQLACLITPGVSESMKEKLSTIFNVVQEVNLLDSADSANLALLQRPELGVTFTKLHCWRLTQYDKCVFLDADTLVIQNCDELFEREELSAAPDVGWPDCFNSGVFVFKPSMDTYSSILKFAIENGSFDGGDQGLLNLYFADWAHKDISKHLPFLYNTSSVATYSYMPAFKQFGENVKIVHFIGTMKPWIQNFDSETKQVNVPGGYNHLAKFLQFWWDIFCEDVHPNLTSDMVCIGLASALAKLQLGKPKSKEQVEYEEHMRRHYWETGSMDYMGRDKFDNIWAKIQETINGSGKQEAGPSQQRRTKSRSRSGTPKRDMKDRSPTPPAEDVVLGEKKEVYKIDATIKEEEIHENIVDEKPMSPPFVHYDPTTNTTTLTKKVFAGYQQIITTKTLEGKTKIQTKTFFDPALDEECLGVDDVEQMIENDEKSNVEVMQEVVELSEVVKVKVEEEIPEDILLQKALETVECMSESIDKVIEQVDELNIDKSSEQDFVILKEPEIDIIEEVCTLKASTKPTETQMMPINIDESIEVILPEIRMVVDVEGPQEITQAESILHSNNDFVIVPENTETPSKETEFELVECPKDVNVPILSQKCETTQIESEILPQIIKEVESIPLSHDEMPEPNIEELNGHAPIVENESTEENAASESSTPLQGQLQLQEQSLAGKPKIDVSNMDLMEKIKEIQASLTFLREKMNTLETLFKTNDQFVATSEPKADLDIVLSGFPCNFDVDTVIERLNSIYNFGIHNLANKFKLILDKKYSDEKIYLLLMSFRTLIAKLHFLKEIKSHEVLKFSALVHEIDGFQDNAISVNERLCYKNLDIKKHIQSLVNVMPV